jgi:histidine ammonia-lyase
VETREVGLDDLASRSPAGDRADRPDVDVSPEARERARASRRHIERTENGNHAVYGVTTRFGALATVLIPPEEPPGKSLATLVPRAPPHTNPLNVVAAMRQQ